MPNDPRRTLLGHSPADKAFLFVVFPLIGLVLGFFLPRIADWASKQGWVPFQGPLELIASWEGWWSLAVCILVGGIAGVVIGMLAHDADPHADDFHRWVPDQPELPSALNAVLKAREKSLEKDESEDARDLREEAAKLGYVVRDEETRQYWRAVGAG